MKGRTHKCKTPGCEAQILVVFNKCSVCWQREYAAEARASGKPLFNDNFPSRGKGPTRGADGKYYVGGDSNLPACPAGRTGGA